MGRALGLAVLAHALLVLALTWGVQWKRDGESAAVQAELWSAIPQEAAPPAAAPPLPPTPPADPEPVTPRPPPPEPLPQPVPRPAPSVKAQPPAPTLHDAEIAREKARKRKEDDKREAERQDKLEREKKKREDDKREAQEREKAKKLEKQRQAEKAKKAEDKKAEDKKKLEQQQQREKEQDRKKAEAAKEDAKRKAAADEARKKKEAEAADAKRADAQRADQIKRMQALAGAAGGASGGSAAGSGSQGGNGSPGANGTAKQSSGPSAGYGGRIKARIRPNIVFTDEVAGNPVAEVEVRTAPDGTIVSRRLVKSSGNKAWDEAVLKAIDKTETLPRDVDGRVPPELQLVFRPKD